MSENSILNPLNLISLKLSFPQKKNHFTEHPHQPIFITCLFIVNFFFFLVHIHVILFSTININFFYLNIYVSTIFFRFNPKTNQKKKAILLLSKKKIKIKIIYKQKQQHYENIQYVFDVVCFNTILFYFP